MLRPILSVVFSLSGFAALLYQVVWQRALFAIFGINVESVTVVVTAFMLGLGLGSLAGGALSKRDRWPALLVFAALELGIGLFGFFSLPIFAAVGRATLTAHPAVTAIVTFGLVLLPTLMMGATLPLLVAHIVRLSGNVGRSVGLLYFVNTLGSALASFAAVLWLLPHLGQAGTARAAAVLNLVVSASGVALYMALGRARAARVASAQVAS
jgi:predicted membrane-bound spermidine synthase